MNKDADFRKYIELTIEKAHRLLKTAEVDLNSGDCESSSSRAYYAVFHMMEGALLFRDLSYSKHSAVIANFNLHFIKQGVFPKEFSKNIERLFEQRQLGDYDVEDNISKEDAVENIAIAVKMVKAIERVLKRKLGKCK